MENHQEQINEKTLKNLDISEFVRERNIKSYTELLAIAEELRTTVKWTLLTFVFSVNKKFQRTGFENM